MWQMNDKEMIDCKICSHKEVCHYHECINDCEEWAKEYQCEYYQPKIPKNAVVIPEKITEQTSPSDLIKIAKYNESVRKETAREILQEIYNFLPLRELSDIEIKTTSLDDVTKAVRFLRHSYIDKVKDLAKQYGVDLGE